MLEVYIITEVGGASEKLRETANVHITSLPLCKCTPWDTRRPVPIERCVPLHVRDIHVYTCN